MPIKWLNNNNVKAAVSSNHAGVSIWQRKLRENMTVKNQRAKAAAAKINA